MNTPSSTCALVAASDFNEEDFESRFTRGDFQIVIALDGGLAHLQKLGVEPDLVIGDFDSLGYVPEGDNVVVYPVKKDESDLELGFDEALARGVEAVTVYGALGGRLDHTVANLQMCTRFAQQGMQVTLVAPDVMVRVLVGPGSYRLPNLAEGVVSVFSACDRSVGVTESGMEYELHDAELTNQTTRGLSNQLMGKPALVSVERGTLLVFHPALGCGLEL